MGAGCTPLQAKHRAWVFCMVQAEHWVRVYALQVTKAKVYIEQKPWTRVQINGQPHDHGMLLRAA